MTVAHRLPTINALISAGIVALCLTGGLSAAQAREAQQAEHQIDVPGAAPFVVYRPETVKAGAPAPLVFLLHGSSGEGASILRRSNLKTLADKYGFIIAAPLLAVLHACR